jgi:hypothetical protein
VSPLSPPANFGVKTEMSRSNVIVTFAYSIAGG